MSKDTSTKRQLEYLETENTLSSKRIKEEPEHDGSFIGDDAVNAEKEADMRLQSRHNAVHYQPTDLSQNQNRHAETSMTRKASCDRNNRSSDAERRTGGHDAGLEPIAQFKSTLIKEIINLRNESISKKSAAANTALRVGDSTGWGDNTTTWRTLSVEFQDLYNSAVKALASLDDLSTVMQSYSNPATVDIRGAFKSDLLKGLGHVCKSSKKHSEMIRFLSFIPENSIDCQNAIIAAYNLEGLEESL